MTVAESLYEYLARRRAKAPEGQGVGASYPEEQRGGGGTRWRVMTLLVEAARRRSEAGREAR